MLATALGTVLPCVLKYAVLEATRLSRLVTGDERLLRALVVAVMQATKVLSFGSILVKEHTAARDVWLNITLFCLRCNLGVSVDRLMPCVLCGLHMMVMCLGLCNCTSKLVTWWCEVCV